LLQIRVVSEESLRGFCQNFPHSSKLANKIKLSGTLNFVKTDFKTPPISFGSGSGTGNGSGISVFADVLYTPNTVDLMGLPYETPITHRSVYYRAGNDIQNPRWTTQYASSIDNVIRIFGTGGLAYEIVKNLIVNYKFGLDYYTENQEYQLNKGSVQNDTYVNGLYRTKKINNTIWDNTITINWNKEITSGLKLDLIVGGNSVRELYNQDGMESTEQLVFGFMNHKNFSTHAAFEGFGGYYLQSKSEVNTLGLFGQASFDYKNYLYLNIAGRNDWYSSLEKENRSLFYPSVSLSFIPTQLFESITSNNGLNFLKLRVGYGTSAGFPPAYVTRDTYGLNTRAFVNGNVVVPSNSPGVTLGNPDLKPELHREIEIGLEAKGLSNRLGIDFTYYIKKTKDLITNADLDPATGYDYTFMNIGSITNSGIEIEFNATPVKTQSLQWDLTLMFTKTQSEVTELAEGAEQIRINGFTNLGNFAKVGEPYGVIMGNAARTNEDGIRVVDGTGLYISSNDLSVIGNPFPDFETSLNSTLQFKGFSFGMLWEYRKGGDIYSGTASALLARGNTKDTDFDRTQTWVLPGISDDTGLPNTIQISATNFGFNVLGFAPHDLRMYDGTTIRLREVSLGYTFPSKLLAKTPFGSGSITFSGYNLWYNAVNFPKYLNFDTDVSSTGVGNGMGFDYITGPSTSRYGVSLRLSF